MLGFGMIAHASKGRIMLAMLKKIPVDIMTVERYFNPWNSDKYDIKTAKGPQILKRKYFEKN